MARNIDDVAWVALMRALAQPRSHRQEYIGSIYPSAEGFEHTEPTNVAAMSSRGGKAKAAVPANSEALFHNHPAGKNSGTFSGEDVQVADRLGWTSYIAAPRGHGQGPAAAQIRKYVPGVSETRTALGSFGSLKISEGEPVLAQFPMQQYLQVLAQRNPLVAAMLQSRGVMASR